MKNWKTSAGFIAAGVGVLLTGVTQGATEPWILFGNVSLSGLGVGLTALGIIWGGVASRDYNVTSKGVKVDGSGL